MLAIEAKELKEALSPKHGFDIRYAASNAINTARMRLTPVDGFENPVQ
jgi:hypothetical protein